MPKDRLFGGSPRFFAAIAAGLLAVASIAASAQQADLEAEAYRLNQFALALVKEGRISEAIPLARRALDLSVKIHGAVHRNVAADAISLANLYMSQRDVFNAEPLILRAIDVDKKLYGATHPEVAVDLGSLAMLYREKGDQGAAIATFREALDILNASSDRNRYLPQAAVFHRVMGRALIEMQRGEDAMLELSRAAEILEITDKRGAIEVLLMMAEVARSRGDQYRSQILLDRAKQLRER